MCFCEFVFLYVLRAQGAYLVLSCSVVLLTVSISYTDGQIKVRSVIGIVTHASKLMLILVGKMRIAYLTFWSYAKFFSSCFSSIFIVEKTRIQPVILEVNFCPQTSRGSSMYPPYWNEVFQSLFLTVGSKRMVLL